MKKKALSFSEREWAERSWITLWTTSCHRHIYCKILFTVTPSLVYTLSLAFTEIYNKPSSSGSALDQTGLTHDKSFLCLFFKTCRKSWTPPPLCPLEAGEDEFHNPTTSHLSHAKPPGDAPSRGLGVKTLSKLKTACCSAGTLQAASSNLRWSSRREQHVYWPRWGWMRTVFGFWVAKPANIFLHSVMLVDTVCMLGLLAINSVDQTDLSYIIVCHTM